MFKMEPAKKKVFDYIGAYEKAIRDLISSCGSREAANELLDELHENYESTYARLQQLDREMSEDHPLHPVKKRAILARANSEVHTIIEAHLPHTSEHVKELILGASLATVAVMTPVSALAPLAVATSVVAIGSSYYIGFKILRNWKTISGKHKVAHFAGVVGPKHVKGLRGRKSRKGKGSAKAFASSGGKGKARGKSGGKRGKGISGISTWLRGKKA